MRNVLLAVLLLGLLVSLGTATAWADILTYTETATASGTLNGTAFSNALVTLTLTGNTSDISVSNGGTFFQLTAPTTVSVAGVGSDTFSDSVPVFNNQLQPFTFAGFYDQTSCMCVVLATTDNAFASYDLSTPIGPITDTASFSTAFSYKTVGGSFHITSVSSDSTFTATAPVPEPSTLLLLATGLFGLSLLARRCVRAAFNVLTTSKKGA